METIMTDYEKFLKIDRIIAIAARKIVSAGNGKCPHGMTEEQWEEAQLSDVLEQIAEGAIADIKGVLR